jgi:hypothetical protein
MLNPGNELLWQRPVDSFDEATRYWYTNQVLGKNTLAGMLKTIFRRVGQNSVSKSLTYLVISLNLNSTGICFQ